jgi:acetyl esterase/lipase
MKKTLLIIGMLTICNFSIAQQTIDSATSNQGFNERIKEKLLERKNNKENTDSILLKDLSYGNHKLQKFDLYIPKSINNLKNAPILIMVHGGGWKRGDKVHGAALENKVNHFNSKGMIVASINYRLTPEANPIEQAHDVSNAFIHIQNNASTWGGDGNKIILMGHSAGAHLVTLITADGQNKFAKNTKPWLGTVSLDGAAIDIESSMEDGVKQKMLMDIYDNAFGSDPKFWAEASPMSQLNSNAKPMLLICSSSRPDKPCKQTQDFVNKAKSMNVSATILPIRMSHGQINSNVGLDNELTQEIDKFIKNLVVQ